MNDKLFYKCLDDILLSKKYFSEKLQKYFATPSSAKVLKISQNSETVFVNFCVKTWSFLLCISSIALKCDQWKASQSFEYTVEVTYS